MLYIPCHLFQFWVWVELRVAPQFSRRLGWFTGTPKLASFEQMLTRQFPFVLQALKVGEPMEAQVYEALGYRDLSRSDLQHVVNSYAPGYPMLKPDCTVQTALNRLMRQDKVYRVLHQRGWFRWYVYVRKG